MEEQTWTSILKISGTNSNLNLGSKILWDNNSDISIIFKCLCSTHHLYPSFGETHGKTETTNMSLNHRQCHKMKTALNKREDHQFFIWLFILL